MKTNDYNMIYIMIYIYMIQMIYINSGEKILMKK